MSIFSIEYKRKNHKVASLSRIARHHRGNRGQEAVEALAQIGDGEAARALLQLASEEDIAVWEPARQAIGRIRNESAVPALTDALLTGNHELAQPVLSALTQMDSPRALESVLRAMEEERLVPDVLQALHGKMTPEIIPSLEGLLRSESEQEAKTGKMRLWQQNLCREMLELLGETDDIGAVKALHHFLRDRQKAPERLRTQAAELLTRKGTEGREALAGYIGEDFTDVSRVMLLAECLPDDELVDILYEVMPPKTADEFGQSLMACLNRMREDRWPYLAALIERLDRENARSALLLWFVQTKAVSTDAAYVLARHGNTRPVLVKRLVDMVRYEDRPVRLRAGKLLHRLYEDKLITEEGVHLIAEKKGEDGGTEDFEYIGYKD